MPNEQEQVKEQEVLKIMYVVDTKQFKVNINTTHIPMLTYALKLLELEIENAIIGDTIKNQPQTLIKSPTASLRDFLNKKR